MKITVDVHGWYMHSERMLGVL